MNVGEYIKSLRQKKGWTQEELGEKLGVKRAAVNKWESGMVQNLKRSTIQKLAEIFQVSPSSFVSENIPPSGMTYDELIKEKPITDLEKQILESFFRLSPKQQEIYMELLEDMVKANQSQQTVDTVNQDSSKTNNEK